MRRQILGNMLLMTASIIFITALSEIAFRVLLFSDMAFMQKFRDPGLYAPASPENETYWLLYYHLGGKIPPPENPDPVLGWVTHFKRVTYTHDTIESISGRRPVLLYGDSFANCSNYPEAKVVCFQKYFNSDKEFGQRHFFLNYGVGGYGVDQIYLTFHNSISHYQRPFVIMSFMLWDLDRSTLSVRGGPKPHFEPMGDQIVLKGVPVRTDAKAFFADHPPQVWSYLFRLWLFSDGWGYRVRNWLRAQVEHSIEQREKTELINKHIISTMVSELKQLGIDHMFLIFYPQSAIERHDDWREAYVKAVLEENDVRYLSAKDIVVSDSVQNQKRFADYFIPGDGHPNSYQNSIIAREIKKVILHETQLEHRAQKQISNRVRDN